MSDNQDIREWARSTGRDIGDRGRIPATLRDEYRAAHNGGPAPAEPDELEELDGNDLDLMPPDAPETPPAPPAADPPREGRVVRERRPEPPPRKRRGFLGREPRAKKAKPAHKRVSLENLVSTGWGLGAMALARSSKSLPMARVMQMQSDVAGIIVDEQLRGTMVDKFLQPFARAGEKGEVAFALAGPPLLVGAMTARPELFPVLKPMLKMSMLSWMQISKPAVEKAQKRVQAFAEEFGEVDLDGMIDALFADIPMATTPSEQEEANIRKARGE